MRRAKRKEPEIQFEPLPAAGVIGFSRRFKVTRGGVVLGFIEQLAAKAGETHPWKAFKPRFVPGGPPQFGDMLNVFYGLNGQYRAGVALWDEHRVRA